MRRKLLLIYIVVSIILADTYIIVSWIRPGTVLNYMLLLYFFFIQKKITYTGIGSISYSFYLFIVFIFFVNLIQNGTEEAFVQLITTLPIPIILQLFASENDGGKLILFYARFYLLFYGVFSIFQMMGFTFTSGSILSNLGIFGTEREFQGATSQGLRITGADTNNIEFSCRLGFLTIIYYFIWRYKFPEKRVGYLLFIAIILMLFTQTRAALYLTVPCIFFSEIVAEKSNRLKNLLIISFSTIILVLILIQLLPYLEQQFPRLFLGTEEDTSVIHRLQANAYGVIGTYLESPWIGIPKEKALDAMNIGFQKIGLFVGDYYIDEVTHHNQVAFFFRYYGFIGLALFLLVYFNMFKLALSKHKTILTQKILAAIILFHFIYTLTHNNKIVIDYFLWIFLALNLFTNNKSNKSLLNET